METKFKTLPAGAVLDAQAAQIVNQQNQIDAMQAQLNSFPGDPASEAWVWGEISNAENQSAASINAVPELTLTLADPPETAGLQQVLDTVNLIITQRRGVEMFSRHRSAGLQLA